MRDGNCNVLSKTCLLARFLNYELGDYGEFSESSTWSIGPFTVGGALEVGELTGKSLDIQTP